jgi:hypothetical protein
MQVTILYVREQDEPASHYAVDCIIHLPAGDRGVTMMVKPSLTGIIAVDMEENGIVELETVFHHQDDDEIDDICISTLRATKRYFLEQKAKVVGLDDELVDILGI